jgi:protein-tyrosine phosphatase
MGLPWRASSRGLALERGVNNVGTMEVSAVKALEARGLRAVAEFGRFPIQATVEDFEAAHWIVALKEAEHLPLLKERFPGWAEEERSRGPPRSGNQRQAWQGRDDRIRCPAR